MSESRPREARSTNGRGPSRLLDAVRDVFHGMLGYEFSRHALETRAALETLFMVGTVGDLIGLPIMPPYYSLKLLPYVVPDIAAWKRRVLRARDFSEEHDFDLHGL